MLEDVFEKNEVPISRNDLNELQTNLNKGNFELHGLVLNAPQLAVTHNFINQMEGSLDNMILEGRKMFDEEMRNILGTL